MWRARVVSKDNDVNEIGESNAELFANCSKVFWQDGDNAHLMVT